MGPYFGLDKLAQGLEALRKYLEQYYGSLTEIEMGLRAEVPDKPDALIYAQQMRETGSLLVEGGIVDQPYIWMLEYRVCLDTTKVFEALRERNRQDPQG